MQSPLPQLTTVLLLIHLGFGCCFHHAHACELGSCEFETAQVGVCEDHSHPSDAIVARDDCHQPPLGIGNDGHHPHECSGEDCTFVAVRPRLVSTIEEASHISSLVVQTPAHAAPASRAALFANGTAAEFARTLLPRTHLTLQVLQL